MHSVRCAACGRQFVAPRQVPRQSGMVQQISDDRSRRPPTDLVSVICAARFGRE